MSNIVIAWGRVDSEIRRKKVGTPPKDVTEFRLNDGKGWITVVAWEKVGDAVTAIGQEIIVKGFMRTRSFDGKDGKVYVTEVVAGSIEPIGVAKAEAAEEEDLFS